MNKEAEDLAASLSKTLAPFFARNAEESEENVFETWGTWTQTIDLWYDNKYVTRASYKPSGNAP
jgi:hypothetical protein